MGSAKPSKVRVPLFCIVLPFLNLLSCWITGHWWWLKAPNFYIRCSNKTSQNVSQSNTNLFYFHSPWNFRISNLPHCFILSDTIQEEKTKTEVFACCCNLRGYHSLTHRWRTCKKEYVQPGQWRESQQLCGPSPTLMHSCTETGLVFE